jgi:alpha-L-arabinofuranosidase
MMLTPSYHVFEMYSVHQGASMVPVNVKCGPYDCSGYSVPAVSASASVDGDGKLHLTMSNADPHQDQTLKIHLDGMKARQVQGRVLTGQAMNAHNTFEDPECVTPRPFDLGNQSGESLEVVLPRMSVVVLEAAA